MPAIYPHRVFISYSHEDRDKVERVAELLENIGLRPIWDKNLLPGVPFGEQIKNGIAYAHVFMPIVTASAIGRPWVHQEIGYAMGLDVPILPLAVGELPPGMTQEIQALSVDKELTDLEERLTVRVFEHLVTLARRESHARFSCADQPEMRTQMLVDFARRVLDLGAHGRVRESASLSSFCIPDRHVEHPIWDTRQGPLAQGPALRRSLREQRRVLQEHATSAGCDLIINLAYAHEKHGQDARKARLQTLIEFLESMTDEQVRVAVKQKSQPHNLLIVGDWFMAESVAPGSGAGWLQTVLTSHAPTVLDRLSQFDEEFEDLLREAGHAGVSSRVAAIASLKQELSG